MAFRVSSLELVERQGFEYVFIVFSGAYISSIGDEINKLWENFGRRLGEVGVAYHPFDESIDKTTQQLKEKQWPKAIAERIEKETKPYMLLINKDFKVFDPRQDKYAFFWFSSVNDQIGLVSKVFGATEVEAITKPDHDLFQYVKELNRNITSPDLSWLPDITPPGLPVTFHLNEIFTAISDKIAGARGFPR
jgi:hypothetical protein